jgi:hypothetical protein
MTAHLPTAGMPFEKFIKGGFCRVLDEGTRELRPLTPYPAQYEFIRAVDAIDPATKLRRYARVAASLPKKAGKSTLAAALAVWGLAADPFAVEPEVLILASDQAQTRDVVFNAAAKMIERDSWLAERCQIKATEIILKRKRRDPTSGATYSETGVIRALAADVRGGLHGSNPSVVVVDEAWTQTGYELLEAVAPSSARRSPLIAYFSYAGLNSQRRKGNPWYDVTTTAREGSDPRLYWWELTGPNAWKVIPWATPAWVESMRAQFSACPSKYKRLVENAWTTGDDGLVSAEELAAALIDGPEPEYGDPSRDYFCGIDLGLKNDFSSLALVSLDSNSHACVDVVRFWRGTPDRPVRIGDVEAEIDRLRGRFNICKITADFWQAAQLIERARERGAQAEAVQLTAGIVDASITKLKSLFSSRSIHLNRRHVELVEQLESLKVIEGRRRDLLKFSPSGTGPSAAVHDDLCWAVLMALLPVFDKVGRLALPVQSCCPLALSDCYLFNKHSWGGNYSDCLKLCPSHQTVVAAWRLAGCPADPREWFKSQSFQTNRMVERAQAVRFYNSPLIGL